MPTNWKIGDKIENRWEIHHILRGGMGIVYIVYDHEWHEAFAAKPYQDEIFVRNPESAERFRQEALAWVNLDVHQNITRAKFVHTIHGKPHLFLEYVSGGDLSSWIGTPRLTEDLPQVLRFAIQFCDGMSHALSKGIKAHRDIKPHNCLVTEDRTLKVTDFGLAKVFDDAAWLETDLASNVHGLGVCQTQTGIGAGSVQYMAPEQFEDFKQVGVPSDIYSFGVMLYQMVTGHLPFEAETWKDFEWLHKTKSPETVPIQPEFLRGIIETSLQKDPARRFASFSALRQRLADIYEKLTQRAAPQPVSGKDLNGVDLTNKGASLANLGLFEQAIVCCDQALKLNPQFEQAWSNRGAVLHKLGCFEEANSCYEKALELNPRDEQAFYNMSLLLMDLDRSEDAISCCEKALELNPRFEQAWISKGCAFFKLDRVEKSLPYFDKALELNPRDELAWYNKGIGVQA